MMFVMVRYVLPLSLFVICLTLCVGLESRPEYLFMGENYFRNMAFSNEKVTDKVNGHVYQKMYGMVLLPQIEKHAYINKKLKFLEIGFGCGSYYGPGASVKVWQQMFKGRDVDMWAGEFDEKCVQSLQEEGKLHGVSVLIGNQSDPSMLKRWIRKSGGKFDVIIYDGSHKNNHVMHTFMALWPELNPGGNYFIEDMEVGFNPAAQEPGYPPVTKVTFVYESVAILILSCCKDIVFCIS